MIGQKCDNTDFNSSVTEENTLETVGRRTWKSGKCEHWMPPQKIGKKIVERYGLLNNLEGQMKINGRF
jgi:hypothetical protein